MCCEVSLLHADPSHHHLCTELCGKMLNCAKHTCPSFCHTGPCKPCNFVSSMPLACACGLVKLDPPILCGTPVPLCTKVCNKVLECGHTCLSNCHYGDCPPCQHIIHKYCICGKSPIYNAICSKLYNCSIVCGKLFSCGHTCEALCHKECKK